MKKIEQIFELFLVADAVILSEWSNFSSKLESNLGAIYKAHKK